MYELEEEEETENKRYYAFLNALHDLDPRSQAVMEASLNGKANDEIAAELGFINSQAVADKKKNCKKKLIRILAGYTENKELTNETLYLHRP
jgi:DNA-binding NarL/FixJ family response regulator